MAEYIDREKAIEFIRINYCKDCNSYNGVRCRACSFDDAMLGIEDVPAADVVEVVRCKDCKICELRYPTKAIGEEAIRGYYCYIIQRYVDPTDFCSYGEKRSDTE